MAPDRLEDAAALLLDFIISRSSPSDLRTPSQTAHALFSDCGRFLLSGIVPSRSAQVTTTPSHVMEHAVMKILVLQWAGSTLSDFDDLASMEAQLENSLSNGSTVDGHDMGSGQMKIFIETDRPVEVFAEVAAILAGNPRWDSVRAAYRDSTGDDYTSLRPLDGRPFQVT